MTVRSWDVTAPAAVRILRGRVVESEHRAHAVVVDATGNPIASWGDPRRVTFLRSAAKPFQTIPLLESGAADRFGITDEEVALCCGSHNSEARHVAVARSILARAGLDDSDLEGGPHRPLREAVAKEMARRGEEATAIHSNCSGKHAGMLALAVHHGWPTRGYIEPDHPVQRCVTREVARWCRLPVEALGLGRDGCGVVCFAVPLAEMAGAYARLCRATGTDAAARRVVGAMRAHPFMVAGTDRLCTALMEGSPSLVAKVGAEGVYCAGDVVEEVGVAIKIEDGSRRAAGAVLLAVLDGVGLLGGSVDVLAPFRVPEVTNTRGEVVGRLEIELGEGWRG